MDENIFSPGPREQTVRDASGTVHSVPKGWILLPPGDAALTRRTKAAGKFWTVQEKKGRKVFSKGIYAPAETIAKLQKGLESERSTERYAKQKEAATKRREKTQSAYVEDFQGAVVAFLRFAPKYHSLCQELAQAVSDHATPVGSGTVARTKRIPIEQRAEAAVIAWMRHQTTAYDQMKIARVKGMRREVRRMLAERSRELLNGYRLGLEMSPACPLVRALRNPPKNTGKKPLKNPPE